MKFERESSKLLIFTWLDESATITTGIESSVKREVSSVEFDYKVVYDREDKYNDVIGFYHTHPPGANFLSQIDEDTMSQWVRCLGKDLVCLIETEEKLNGWIFTRGPDGKVYYYSINAWTENDINYNISRKEL